MTFLFCHKCLRESRLIIDGENNITELFNTCAFTASWMIKTDDGCLESKMIITRARIIEHMAKVSVIRKVSSMQWTDVQIVVAPGHLVF